MTIQVRKNTPPPTPPATYEITGLSFNQAAVIRDLLGTIPSGCDHPNAREVYRALYTALPGLGSDYQFTSGNGVDSGLSVRTLYVHQRG